jgi:hypothetical protein
MSITHVQIREHHSFCIRQPDDLFTPHLRDLEMWYLRNFEDGGDYLNRVWVKAFVIRTN